jgi:galactonate dehydratase
MVDCHCRFDLPLALEVAQRLQEFDLAWLEEPVPRDQTDAMLKVAAQSGVTLAGGEGFFSRGDCWDWIRRGAVQVIMPDAKHAGGITECRRIAQLAEVAHVGFSPHNPAGPVSTMAAVHLSASVANFWVLEFAFGEVDWRESLTVPNEWVANGCIQVPDRPGLGIELNRSLLNSLSARPLGG